MTHQQASRKFLKNRPRVFDMSDAGTGKTPVHVTDFAERRRKDGGCCLVLCPKSLIKSAWGNDFATFAPDMKVSMAYADNRDIAFEADADVYITNIDAAAWLAKKRSKFWAKFDTLIIDESTAIKHASSNRSQSVRKFVREFPWRRLLSGTPNPNGICDIWHQVLVLDDGERLGDAFYAFRSATCNYEKRLDAKGKETNFSHWVDKPGIEPIVGALLEDIVIRHEFEKCVDIPPNHRWASEYELGKKHREQYEKLERDAALFLKNHVINAVNGGVLYNKLLQCASGAVYATDLEGETDYALIDVGRYELIGDLIEARKHSVCFFNWQHQKDQMVRIAEKEGWSYAIIDGTVTQKGKREQIVEDYQLGRYKVLFAHPQSAGHGLTLTKGTASIFCSPTANLEHFLQAYKRIYRITQKEKTETIMVIAKGTIDERVWLKCQQKNVKLTELLSYLC